MSTSGIGEREMFYGQLESVQVRVERCPGVLVMHDLIMECMMACYNRFARSLQRYGILHFSFFQALEDKMDWCYSRISAREGRVRVLEWSRLGFGDDPK
jgi:hypothetical protein